MLHPSLSSFLCAPLCRHNIAPLPSPYPPLLFLFPFPSFLYFPTNPPSSTAPHISPPSLHPPPPPRSVVFSHLLSSLVFLRFCSLHLLLIYLFLQSHCAKSGDIYSLNYDSSSLFLFVPSKQWWMTVSFCPFSSVWNLSLFILMVTLFWHLS